MRVGVVGLGISNKWPGRNTEFKFNARAIATASRRASSSGTIRRETYLDSKMHGAYRWFVFANLVILIPTMNDVAGYETNAA